MLQNAEYCEFGTFQIWNKRADPPAGRAGNIRPYKLPTVVRIFFAPQIAKTAGCIFFAPTNYQRRGG